jgi:plastocyanin
MAFRYGFFTFPRQSGAMRRLVVLVLFVLAAPAAAAQLSVEVRNAKGAPVPNAVISLYPDGRAVPVAAPRAPLRIEQHYNKFSPFVLVVPVGGEVAFPNLDSFRHHVYSFSPVRRFELKLFAKEQNRTVRFDKAGPVPLGCNIHDSMTAFVKVSDTALAVTTDAAGRATFPNVPPGAVVARIWHPYLRAPANQIEARWTVPRAGRSAQSVAVTLRAPPPVASSY